MLKKIERINLNTKNLSTTGLLFIPERPSTKHCAIFSHGYTTHKGSILTWAQKLMDLEIPCLIFDLPGHYLGNYSDVQIFNHFANESWELFSKSFDAIKENFNHEFIPLIGGHSLGALISLMAAEKNPYFKHNICVGLGSLEKDDVHLFNTPFFKDTMKLRAELVSSCLNPKVMLPWIATQKQSLHLENNHIYLIAGKDDIIIGGTEGVERMASYLKENNQVHIELIAKLPHHLPENAGLFVKKIIKEKII